MAYINSDFQKALDTLQAWSVDLTLALSACLETEEGTSVATYFAQLPDDVLTELRHCSALFHAAALALSTLTGTESELLAPMRQTAKQLDNFAGFILYILDAAVPEKAE